MRQTKKKKRCRNDFVHLWLALPGLFISFPTFLRNRIVTSILFFIIMEQAAELLHKRRYFLPFATVFCCAICRSYFVLLFLSPSDAKSESTTNGFLPAGNESKVLWEWDSVENENKTNGGDLPLFHIVHVRGLESRSEPQLQSRHCHCIALHLQKRNKLS